MYKPPKDYREIAENEVELGEYVMRNLNFPNSRKEHLVIVKNHSKDCTCRQCLAGLLSSLINTIREQHAINKKFAESRDQESNREGWLWWLSAERELERICMFTRHVKTIGDL